MPKKTETKIVKVTAPAVARPIRNLVLILGDQLNRDASAWDGFDATQDCAWMCEASEESAHAWSSKQRTTLFLSAMRHFAQSLRDAGVPLLYREMGPHDTSLAGCLAQTLAEHRVQRVVLTEPGDWRVRQALLGAAESGAKPVPIDLREDRHFLASHADFAAHAAGRKQLRMEYFYREMRRKHRVLMDADEPAGGEWNFDAANRESFGKAGPGLVPETPRFAPDAITLQVMALVNSRFAQHPGQADQFGWPVTREQALVVLHSFIDERLQDFGRFQDAMAAGQPWLFHAHIGAAMNLKLLNPREVIALTEAAYRAGRAPLPAVEGFIRQILGWREYVRGIYWRGMPTYAELNGLNATADLPAWFWTGQTSMACLADTLQQTLQHGYAHHIQRLMVTGLYALMHGVEPRQIHLWYLSVYVDAVEWVELPNVLGMSQYADGGVMASKPYVATGKYIQRMSNHCSGCRFDPAQRTGEKACPFTTLYWDFLGRHESLLVKNPRMALQVKNWQRIEAPERKAITARATEIRAGHVGALETTA